MRSSSTLVKPMLRDYRSGPAGTSPSMGASSPGNAPGKQTLTQLLPQSSPGGATSGADQGDPRLRQVEKYSAFIEEAAAKYGMDVTQLKAIMAVESGGNPNASSGSAFGLMQITRGTWESTRKRDPDLAEYDFEANWRNPRINTLFGAAVLKGKARSMGVTPDDENFATLAVIAYNAGEGTVKYAINHAKAAGSKDPEQDFLKPEHLKPAIEHYQLYSYYLTNATGKKRNKSGTKEEAIELKYKEIISYVPKVEGYLKKLGAGKSPEETKEEDGQSADGATPIGDRDSSTTSKPDQDGPDTDADAPEQGNAPEQDAASTSGTGASGQGPNAERTYQVRRGDTLIAIAKRLLGSSERWREIAQHNGVTDPRTLRVGQTLRIPGTAAGAGNAADRPTEATGEGPASQLAVVEYRVRAGDTLAEIAERLLGSAARWQEIARANGITDPRTLRIGQVLRVPGGSSQAGTGGGGKQQSDGRQQDGRAQQDGGDGGGTGSKPAWISVAEAEIGTKEIAGSRHNPRIIEYHSTTSGRFTNDETAWCASFVNWVLKQAGQSGTNNALALSFKNYGTKLERPAYGSIAVLSYGGGRGHVGFVVGRQGNRLLLLGGNQSNAVNVKAFGTGQIVAYVVPSGYTVPSSAFQLDANGPRVEDSGGVGDTR